jgi:2-amino-4-hydroxy-6-hydroxymethyldihydropteridine diphosphokinase
MAEARENTAMISIGSNMGKRGKNCRRGIKALGKEQHVDITGTSLFYRTAPVHYTDQRWFVNAAVRINTLLNPHGLLEILKSIERGMGRQENAVRFGPRILDMDIVLFGEEIIDSKGLVIPHPRMHERAFVLQPLCDISPEAVHPVLKKSMKDLLDHIADEDQKVEPYTC